MQTNIVHHSDFLKNDLPSKCANLIPADPPYFGVKGDFDFVWNSFEEYKMDVLRVSQEGHITGEYDHDTVKPEKLTRILIKTCSREGDLVVVPFAGSGTECAMSAKEKRPFIAYEITKKHVDMANKRAKRILSEPELF